MDGFLKWFYAFMTTMLEGVWTIVSNFFVGLYKTFNLFEYIKQFRAYSSAFSVMDWVISIFAFLLVICIWMIFFYLIFILIRKFVRLRKSVASQEEIFEEIADLNRQVSKLTNEKDRLAAVTATQLGLPVEALSSMFKDAQNDFDYSRVVEGSADSEALAANDAKAIEGNAGRFFRLNEVDKKYELYEIPMYDNEITLSGICETFRNFACSRMGLYYDIKTIRLMFAGLASTKLILLQGISGTGKTSLPYSMGKFFENDATIASVQPSWRDRNELFGYFNEFTKKFNETEVLKRIYEASYNDDIHLIVLDEMNIARVEYYFAEMLSILEMPDSSEWKLDLVASVWDTDPKHLADGKLSIPQNVWYIGTANNDDSTFAVSDKVYDRALVINLDSKGIAFDAPDTDPMQISYAHVQKLYDEAIEQYPVSKENLDNIGKLDIYVIQKFRVAFGNRIMKQLKIFVPVLVATGGTEIEGIDYILATKVFRKFESLNLSLIRDEIKGLIAYLDKMFGKGNMKECIAYLERLQKMY